MQFQRHTYGKKIEIQDWRYGSSSKAPNSKANQNKLKVAKLKISIVLVAHTCNPSYSRRRDQENRGSKPARANSSKVPISKISSRKKDW
jgi:hypothetical protein